MVFPPQDTVGVNHPEDRSFSVIPFLHIMYLSFIQCFLNLRIKVMWKTHTVGKTFSRDYLKGNGKVIGNDSLE